MKLTVDIEEELLRSVMEITGAVSESDAVNLALSEVQRRRKLVEVLKAGSGVAANRLDGVIDPCYDLLASRDLGMEKIYGEADPSRQ